MVRWAVLTAVAAVTSAAAPLRAQHALVALPLTDPAYEQLDALARQGCRAARVSPFRPFRTGEVRRALARAARDPGCAGVLLAALAARFSAGSPAEAGSGAPVIDSLSSRLAFGAAATLQATARRAEEFMPLWRDVRPDTSGTPPAVGIARARVTWTGADNLVAVLEGYAQTSSRNDPTVRGRGFRQTRAVVDVGEAYVAGRLGSVVVSLGRSAEAWLGADRESLVLSAHGPALDRLAAEARWGRFEARTFFASINDVVLGAVDRLPPGVPDQRVHRFLAGHALTVRPTSGWEITLGETALLTRRGAGFDLAFLNPVMLYVVAESDTGRTGAAADDNNLTIFGGTRVSLGRAVLTGDLLLDDFQIDARDRAVIPDQLGWRVSGSYGLPLAAPASVGLEYTRLNSYTYMRKSYAEVYQAYDQPLGSRLGPDADIVRVSGELWPNGRLRLAGGGGRWRRGALRVDQRPAEGAAGHAGEPFPSRTEVRPVSQEAWLGDVTVQFLTSVFPVTARVDLARIDGVNNQPVPPATYFRAQIVGTYRFRYP